MRKSIPLSLDFIITLSIGLIVFLSQLGLAISWWSLGVFDQYNVVFDSDPNTQLAAFAHGHAGGEVFHPLLVYIVAVPIRLIDLVLDVLALNEDPIGLREGLAISVAPAAAAVKGVLFYRLFRQLEMLPIDAAIVTILGCLSFSSVVFGATPGSYIISAATFVFLSYLAVRNTYTDFKFAGFLSFLVGLVSIGVTLSNAIFVGWMRWAAYISRNFAWFPALMRSIVVTASIMIVAILFSMALNGIRGASTDADRIAESKIFVLDYTLAVEEIAHVMWSFPEIIGRTFIPTLPDRRENEIAAEIGAPLLFELIYLDSDWTGHSLGFLTILAVGGGFFLSVRKPGKMRALAFGALFSILTFIALHSWFGKNTYLYSQYRHVPALIILAGWWRLNFLATRFGRALAVVGLVCLAVGDIWVLGVVSQWFAAGGDGSG